MRGPLNVAVLYLVGGVIGSDVEGELDFEHLAVFPPADPRLEAEKRGFRVENNALIHARRRGNGEREAH